MIDDKLILFDDQAVLTATTSTVIDLVSATHNMGKLAHQARIVLTVGTAMANGTSSGTASSIALLSSTTGGGTFVTSPIYMSISAVTMTAGYEIFNVGIPTGLNRYIEIVITPASAMTAGTVNGYIDVY